MASLATRKLRLPVIILVAISLALVLGISSALANMSGFSVTSVTPNPVTAGAAFDFTFNTQFNNIDDEWLYRFEATLPTGWTINSVANTPPTYLPQSSTQGSSGQTVFWETVDTVGNGYGAWMSGQAYTFRANVTAANCAGAPWSIPWLATGDGPMAGFGGPPFTASGTVTVSCNGAPVITGQPADQTITATQTATLSVTATGATGYQWYAGPSGDTSSPIGGAMGSSYTTPALNTAGAYPYWVRVSNLYGSVDSSTATVTVNPAPVSVTLASALNPSAVGDSVTFNFTAASGFGTPTGNITVTASSGESCVGALAGGAGSCAIVFGTVGARTVSAAYPGDSTFAAGTSPNVNQTVNPAAVTVTLASALNPSAVGDSVTFNFTAASGAGTPTGSVTVTASSGESCVGALAGGAGSCAIVFSTGGARTVSAAYPGDGTFAAGTSADVNQTVNLGGVSVAPTTLNLIEGASGTYSVLFNPVPSGSVTFNIVFDPAQVTVNGVAVSPATLTFAPATFVTFTVAAIDNAVADGSRSTIISQTISAGPPEYPAGTALSDVQVNIQDDDTPGVAVNPTTLLLPQTGAGAAYSIQLLTPPTAGPVMVQVTFDSALVTVNGQATPFTVDLNNTTPVSLVVVALQNNVTTAITHAISASAAAEYPVGMALPAVQVAVQADYPPPPPVPFVDDWNFMVDVPVRTAANHSTHDLVHVRLIVENYHYVMWLGTDLYHGGHIGNMDVINRTIIQAVDVYTIEWLPAFDGDVAICLLGMGEMWFLDANQAPRVPRQLTGWMTPAYPGYTCATLYWPGTLALVEGDPPTIMAPK